MKNYIVFKPLVKGIIFYRRKFWWIPRIALTFTESTKNQNIDLDDRSKSERREKN